jgi:hypothetical protein
VALGDGLKKIDIEAGQKDDKSSAIMVNTNGGDPTSPRLQYILAWPS